MFKLPWFVRTQIILIELKLDAMTKYRLYRQALIISLSVAFKKGLMLNFKRISSFIIKTNINYNYFFILLFEKRFKIE